MQNEIICRKKTSKRVLWLQISQVARYSYSWYTGLPFSIKKNVTSSFT